MKSNMIKRIIPLLSAVTAAALLSGCSIFLYDDESSAADLTTTASKTERNRSTTTKKIYIVDDKDDVEYTTTAHKNSSEDIDPDALERVSVATTKKKDKDKDIVLTTTTTAKPSAYNILQLPKSNEYFDITKQYRISKETELRYGPSGDYTSQVSLNPGDSLSCYGKSGKWYYALYDNNTYGWVEESALEGIAKKTTKKKN